MFGLRNNSFRRCGCPGCPETALPDGLYCAYCEDHPYHIHRESDGVPIIPSDEDSPEIVTPLSSDGYVRSEMIDSFVEVWFPCLGRRLLNVNCLLSAGEGILQEKPDLAELSLEFDQTGKRYLSWFQVGDDDSLNVSLESFHLPDIGINVEAVDDLMLSSALGRFHTRFDLFGFHQNPNEIRCIILSFESTRFALVMGFIEKLSSCYDLYMLDKAAITEYKIETEMDCFASYAIRNHD